MSRGICLLLLACWACGRPGAPGAAAATTATSDVLLRGGWIVDGSGNPRWKGDLGVRGDRIAAIGRLTAARPGRGLRGPGYRPPERRARAQAATGG